MDGTNPREYQSSGIGIPIALTYDPTTQLLIWSDFLNQKIKAILTSESGEIPDYIDQPTTLLHGTGELASLTAHSNTLFWTTLTSPSLFHSSLENVQFFDDQIHLQSMPKMTMRYLGEMFHDASTPKVSLGVSGEQTSALCSSGNHNCAHLCLIGPTNYTCRCADGFTSADGTNSTCKRQHKRDIPEEKVHKIEDELLRLIVDRILDNGKESSAAGKVWQEVPIGTTSEEAAILESQSGSTWKYFGYLLAIVAIVTVVGL